MNELVKLQNLVIGFLCAGLILPEAIHEALVIVHKDGLGAMELNALSKRLDAWIAEQLRLSNPEKGFHIVYRSELDHPKTHTTSEELSHGHGH